LHNREIFKNEAPSRKKKRVEKTKLGVVSSNIFIAQVAQRQKEKELAQEKAKQVEKDKESGPDKENNPLQELAEAAIEAEGRPTRRAKDRYVAFLPHLIHVTDHLM
jgi:hypothetical protein